MIITLTAIGIGGALGAMLRYTVNRTALQLMGHDFPWGTLAVNVTGSLLMGVFIAALAHFWQPPESIRLFLVTGFLGGYTTFSTFTLDVVTLYERGEVVSAGIYSIVSVLLSIGALFSGFVLVKSFVP